MQVLCCHPLTRQTPILPNYTLSFYTPSFFQAPSVVLLVTGHTGLVSNENIRPSLQANTGQSMVTTLLNVHVYCLDSLILTHSLPFILTMLPD